MLNVSNSSVDQIFSQAIAHHQAGRLPDAERLYRQILAQFPQHPDALHMLGVMACQLEKYGPAIELINQAIALSPSNAIFHGNLAETFRKAGHLPQAEQEFRKALQLNPLFADAISNFASMLLTMNRDAEGLEFLQQAVARVPNHAPIHRFLGDALVKHRRFEAAITAYARALQLQPAFTDAQFNMAMACAELGRPADAEKILRAIVARVPDDLDAREQIAEMLSRQDRAGQAAMELKSILQRDPNRQRTWAKFGNILRNIDKVDDAIAAYAHALELDPNDNVSTANQGLALRDQARLAESVALHHRALERNPDAPSVRSSLIFTLQLLPEVTQAQIAAEQREWNRRHVDTVASRRKPHANDRAPDRRLKIGYVSADLRLHPVGRFMIPLLKNHDRSQVEVFIYSCVRNPDPYTVELQGAADHWRAVTAASDDEVAAMIRADGIDILIDLSNHTIDNRMPLFALKPAPVQITYLAYCSNTGLQTIDWRLTDPYIDPPASSIPEPAFEKPLSLAETYWCYAAHEHCGDVAPLPALTRGHITFGAFNYFSKCNDQILNLWAQLIASLPDSHFHIHVPSGSRETYVRSLFQSHDIAPERLTIFPRTKEASYFQRYREIDIALDPFPWSGGTTTCDALYMGVPVITRTSEGPLSRGSASILTNLGHTDWITSTPQEYLAKVRQLGGDIPRLAELRANLRGQMQASVVMNAPRFAQKMEAAFRQAWIAWCSS